jgi:hypothetical protein
MNRTNVFETIGSPLGVFYRGVTNWKHGAACTMAALLLLATFTASAAAQQRIMLGGASFPKTDTLLSVYKAEAALALACELSGSYVLIPNDVRDSVARVLPDSARTAQRVADRLGAELIVFIDIARIVNLVRVQITLVGGEGWIISTEGTGYATSFLTEDGTGRRVIDPAILTATQRALCGAVLQPNLYATADSAFRVQPTQLTALGGTDFVREDKDLAPWALFREKVAASYDVASTIVAAMRNHDSLTVIDMETRDSIYAMAGLFMVENYNPASKTELKILKGFEVTRLITGVCERIRGGAGLRITHNELMQDATYTPLSKAEVIIPVDSKVALQDAVRFCLKNLYGTLTEQREPSR